MYRVLYLLLVCISLSAPSQSIALPVFTQAPQLTLSQEAERNPYLVVQSPAQDKTIPDASFERPFLGLVPGASLPPSALVGELVPQRFSSSCTFIIQELLLLAPKTSPPFGLVVPL